MPPWRRLLALAACTLVGCTQAPPPPAPASMAKPGAANLSIAVPPLAGQTAAATDIGRMIAEVVTADLSRGGRFPGRVDMPAPPPAGAQPDFAAWKGAGASALVDGRVTENPQGFASVEIRLWDINQQNRRMARRYTGRTASARQMAHLIADSIQQSLTGAEGSWGNQLTFIAEDDTGKRRIGIMDHDGADRRWLTTANSSGYRTLRASGNPVEITFDVTTATGPQRQGVVLETAARRTIAAAEPIRSELPSPDGTLVAFLRGTGEGASLWVRSRDGSGERPLASTVVAGTAAWAPNGRKLSFVRKAGGVGQLFVADVDGGEYAIPCRDSVVEAAWIPMN